MYALYKVYEKCDQDQGQIQRDSDVGFTFLPHFGMSSTRLWIGTWQFLFLPIEIKENMVAKTRTQMVV